MMEHLISYVFCFAGGAMAGFCFLAWIGMCPAWPAFLAISLAFVAAGFIFGRR